MYREFERIEIKPKKNVGQIIEFFELPLIKANLQNFPDIMENFSKSMIQKYNLLNAHQYSKESTKLKESLKQYFFRFLFEESKSLYSSFQKKFNFFKTILFLSSFNEQSLVNTQEEDKEERMEQGLEQKNKQPKIDPPKILRNWTQMEIGIFLETKLFILQCVSHLFSLLDFAKMKAQGFIYFPVWLISRKKSLTSLAALSTSSSKLSLRITTN